MAQDDPLSWIRPEVRRLAPYHVVDPGDAIKLDAMENPYRLPVDLEQPWLERLRKVPINRYPDPGAEGVRSRLARALGMREGNAIVLGNGSDELIQIIALSVAERGRVVLAPGPSFVMYRMIAAFTGMRFVEVPLQAENYTLDMPAMRTAIERFRPAVVFLSYPNNPTGNLWRREEVLEILELSPGIVVVDEAYAPFASDTLVDVAGSRPGLVVMRTLSKMGLAGLRLGLAVGDAPLIGEFDKLRLPYNINVLTQASVEFALDHAPVFERQAERIRADRGELFRRLAAMDGVRPYSSEANFILFRVIPGIAASVHACLRERGVLIKNLATLPQLEDCLRVTVGSPEENTVFLDALGHCLG
ncbi:MAG: histidinol-phosphate transaminase [Pseudomonadota bacterium]|nr:histidinol-phosphate transaminase [Pseudomonadota bacterium]